MLQSTHHTVPQNGGPIKTNSGCYVSDWAVVMDEGYGGSMNAFCKENKPVRDRKMEDCIPYRDLRVGSSI